MNIDGAEIMRRIVLRNQVLVGSVNASRDHFQLAVDDLALAETRWPGRAAELVTHRHAYADFDAAFQHQVQTRSRWCSSGQPDRSREAAAQRGGPDIHKGAIQSVRQIRGSSMAESLTAPITNQSSATHPAFDMRASADDRDQLCINTIRTLSIDAVQKADSGHPGMPMGAATMAYVLWTRHLRHNPRNPAWPDRDRFVLSAGHASMLLYSLLFLTGYDLTMDDIEQFRQWKSRTPGHPERGRTPGVEVTTGPLGQGFGNSVGLAIAERWLAATFNRHGDDVVDHYTYVLASDGDLMEGVASEAASLAGTLQLGRLIVLYDANRITLSATTNVTFTEDVGARFEAYGWHVQRIDGQDAAAVDAALTAARADRGSPVADRGPHAYRLRQPAQAGHLACPRRAARRRGGALDEARAWMA